VIHRRDFIRLLGGAAAAWPLAARAQKAAVPVIGFLHVGTPDSFAFYAAAFAKGLKESDYVEGQNVGIEYRWANAQYERLNALAADLVHRQVTVIVAGGGTGSAVAAKAATSAIPIVIVFGSNPVGLGLVATLSRPASNVTGATFFTAELMSKRLSLLLEMIPEAGAVGYLAEDPRMFTETRTFEDMKTEMAAAAQVFNRQLVVMEIGNDHLDAAFATFAEHHVAALIVQPSPIFSSHINQITSLAAHYRIPAIYYDRRFTAAGGLMAYSTDVVAAWHDGGVYVGKILKGAKPADLPFVQSTKFELVINLKTAKALGLTVPPTLLAIADDVIE
jgi:putative ABC transport system substrate-binding protein